MWFLKAPYYHLGFLAVLRPNPAPHRRSSSGPKSLMVSFGWLYLEGYFSPLAPRGRALQPPSSHTCLESAQCFTLTLSHAPIHAQADECPRVVQTSSRGNGFALPPDMFPSVKKGFCSGITIWNFYSLFSAHEGDCSGEMLTGRWVQGYALQQQCSALEQLTEELFFFPCLMLSRCSLSLLWGNFSQDYTSFLCWSWAFLSTKSGAKPSLASVARDRGAEAPLSLQLSSETLLKLPFQSIPFSGGTHNQILLAP